MGGRAVNLKRLDWILLKVQDVQLRERDEKFINSLIERRERYGDSIRITEKQETWLENIAERYIGDEQ
jgi:hypothetical protein